MRRARVQTEPTSARDRTGAPRRAGHRAVPAAHPPRPVGLPSAGPHAHGVRPVHGKPQGERADAHRGRRQLHHVGWLRRPRQHAELVDDTRVSHQGPERPGLQPRHERRARERPLHAHGIAHEHAGRRHDPAELRLPLLQRQRPVRVALPGLEEQGRELGSGLGRGHARHEHSRVQASDANARDAPQWCTLACVEALRRARLPRRRALPRPAAQGVLRMGRDARLQAARPALVPEEAALAPAAAGPQDAVRRETVRERRRLHPVPIGAAAEGPARQHPSGRVRRPARHGTPRQVPPVGPDRIRAQRRVRAPARGKPWRRIPRPDHVGAGLRTRRHAPPALGRLRAAGVKARRRHRPAGARARANAGGRRGRVIDLSDGAGHVGAHSAGAAADRLHPLGLPHAEHDAPWL